MAAVMHHFNEKTKNVTAQTVSKPITIDNNAGG